MKNLRDALANLRLIKQQVLPRLKAFNRGERQRQATDKQTAQECLEQRRDALGWLRCANLACTKAVPYGEPQPKAKRCAACRAVRYCDTSCQKADWREHKSLCKDLAAPA